MWVTPSSQCTSLFHLFYLLCKTAICFWELNELTNSKFSISCIWERCWEYILSSNDSFILSGPCRLCCQSPLCSKIRRSVLLSPNTYAYKAPSNMSLEPHCTRLLLFTHKSTRVHNYSAFHIQWTTSWLTAVCAKVKELVWQHHPSHV